MAPGPGAKNAFATSLIFQSPFESVSKPSVRRPIATNNRHNLPIRQNFMNEEYR